MAARDDSCSRNETEPLLPRLGSEQDDIPHHDQLTTWSTELKLLGQSTGPLVVTYLLQYTFSVISVFIAGRLSADDLAAASIGVTTMNIVGFSIFEGMATALDTLCAQAYGSGKKTDVGLYVQRMVVLMMLVAVPIGVAWICSPWILVLFVKQHHLALKAGSFLRYSLIGVPGYALFEAGKRFLQAQGDFNSGLAVLVLCAPINALLSWLFAFKLGMGLDGAALGAAVANDLRPILLYCYVRVFGAWSYHCWPELSWDIFRGWRRMVSLSAAGSIMTLGEWAAFEILTFSTSYVSTVHLAAQTILSTAAVIIWHIPFSMSVAVSTRIGHLVGADAIKAAKRVASLYAVVFIVVGVLDGVVLFSLRNQIGIIFSNDERVRAITADTMLFLSIFQVVDAINSGLGGMLRGLGRQAFGAWTVCIVNYLAAVPFAIWLELGVLDMKIKGVWTGLGSGIVVIAILEVLYLRHISWRRRDS